MLLKLPSRGRIGGWALRWAVFFGLWMALVDTRKLPEVVAGAVAAVIAATGAGLASQETSARPSIRVGFLRRAPRVLWRLPLETVILARELVRAVGRRGRRTGRHRAVRFRHSGGEEAAGRRVVSEYFGTVAPNRFVIGIDASRQYMLVHELVSTDEPLDTMELG
jgi:hypothetical protein